MLELFATTALGLEEALAGELLALGIEKMKKETAGVRFYGSFEDCMRANLYLRTSARVVMMLAEFRCESPEDLYDGVREIDWRTYFPRDETFAVSASVRDSALTHSVYAAMTVKDAVCDSLRDLTGRRPNIDRRTPDIRLVARLIGDRAVIGIDTSGESLHLRGYRASSGEAPLRETLAAGLVLISGWNGADQFFDPMCGTGTIPVEAALIARNMPPNLDRENFGFMRLPWFERSAWERIREHARAGIRDAACVIEASDIDEGNLRSARLNAEAAGVSSLIRFTRRDIRDFPKAMRFSTAVMNPPYGDRMGEVRELRPLYRTIGDTFHKRFRGSTLWILAGHTGLAKLIPLKPSVKKTLFNGAIRCRYLRFDIE